jgi:hypothetical protein
MSGQQRADCRSVRRSGAGGVACARRTARRTVEKSHGLSEVFADAALRGRIVDVSGRIESEIAANMAVRRRAIEIPLSDSASGTLAANQNELQRRSPWQHTPQQPRAVSNTSV